MYIKYIFAKCIPFNFGFHFLVFGLDILIFTKLMVYNIIIKKEINFKSSNSRNNEYIYGIYNIIKTCFYFWNALGLGLSYSTKKCLK
jgi:hypothetical protein